MVNLFKATIKAKTAYVGKLGSNTFFGAFCCAYKNIYGEDDLVHLLRQIYNGEQELTFSSAFKKGYIPQRLDKLADSERNMLVKKITIGTEKEEVISGADKTVTSVKSKLSEESETFSVVQKYAEDELEVYIATSLSKSLVEKVMKVVVANGLGARKSTGNGYFTLESLEEETFEYNKNGFIALSEFIPDETTPTICKIDTTLRRSVNTRGDKQKDLLLLIAGSVFLETNEVKPAYGKVIYDENSKTYINCKTIAFPVKM